MSMYFLESMFINFDTYIYCMYASMCIYNDKNAISKSNKNVFWCHHKMCLSCFYIFSGDRFVVSLPPVTEFAGVVAWGCHRWLLPLTWRAPPGLLLALLCCGGGACGSLGPQPLNSVQGWQWPFINPPIVHTPLEEMGDGSHGHVVSHDHV